MTLESCNYVPLLNFTPSEMKAVRELPSISRKSMLAHLQLRRWLSSHRLDNSIDKLVEVFGEQIISLGLSSSEIPDCNFPVASTIRTLCQSKNGYLNWYSFLREINSFRPALQMEDNEELVKQADRLLSLERGITIRFGSDSFFRIPDVISAIGDLLVEANCLIILDFGLRKSDILSRTAEAIGYIEHIRRSLPNSYVVAASSTFPSSFVGLNSQEIYERKFFSALRSHANSGPLIYGDHGSANRSSMNGGGQPAPRVDLPSDALWSFFREPIPDGAPEAVKIEAYCAAADRAMKSHHWDPALKIWGTQMIERAAAGDRVIYYPGISTAVRINIHLHRQALLKTPEMYETDDPWTDL